MGDGALWRIHDPVRSDGRSSPNHLRSAVRSQRIVGKDQRFESVTSKDERVKVFRRLYWSSKGVFGFGRQRLGVN